jgi:hypothetical protein
VQLPVTLALSPFPFAKYCRSAAVSLTLKANGMLEIEQADATRCECSVHPHTTVFGWLVVLLYRCDRRVESLVLPRGRLSARAHRQLRLWLRWKAATSR